MLKLHKHDVENTLMTSMVNVALFLLKWCLLTPIDETELGDISLQRFKTNRKLKIAFLAIRLVFLSCTVAMIILLVFYFDTNSQDYIGMVTFTLHCSEEIIILIFYIRDCFSLLDILKILNALREIETIFGARTSESRKNVKIIIVCTALGMVKMYKSNNWNILLLLLTLKHLVSFAVLQATIYIWITIVTEIKELLDTANYTVRNLLKHSQYKELTANLREIRMLYGNLFLVTKDINSYFNTKLFCLIASRFCNILFALFELYWIISVENSGTWIIVCSILFYCAQIFAVVTACVNLQVAVNNLTETIFEADGIFGGMSSGLRTLVRAIIKYQIHAVIIIDTFGFV